MKSDEEFIKGIYAKAEGRLAMEQMAGKVLSEKQTMELRKVHRTRRTAISVLAAAAGLLLCFIVIKPELFQNKGQENQLAAEPMTMDLNTRETPVETADAGMEITGIVQEVTETADEFTISVLLTKDSGSLLTGACLLVYLSRKDEELLFPEEEKLQTGREYRFTVVEKEDVYRVTAVWD